MTRNELRKWAVNKKTFDPIHNDVGDAVLREMDALDELYSCAWALDAEASRVGIPVDATPYRKALHETLRKIEAMRSGNDAG